MLYKYRILIFGSASGRSAVSVLFIKMRGSIRCQYACVNAVLDEIIFGEPNQAAAVLLVPECPGNPEFPYKAAGFFKKPTGKRDWPQLNKTDYRMIRRSSDDGSISALIVHLFEKTVPIADAAAQFGEILFKCLLKQWIREIGGHRIGAEVIPLPEAVHEVTAVGNRFVDVSGIHKAGLFAH